MAMTKKTICISLITILTTLAPNKPQKNITEDNCYFFDLKDPVQEGYTNGFIMKYEPFNTDLYYPNLT